MKAIIWSKTPCPFCEQAKEMLRSNNIEFEDRDITKGWTLEQLREAVPNAQTIPQIFIDGEFVGGIKSLRERLNG